MFIKDLFYTRRQIHNEVGGSLQQYLPTSKGRVVCACLTKEKNPTFPGTILVGDRPLVKDTAALLCSQHEPIPVFLKEVRHKWRYVGLYKFDRDSISADDISKYAEISGRTNITRVVHLVEVG